MHKQHVPKRVGGLIRKDRKIQKIFKVSEVFTHFTALLAHIVRWQIHKTPLFVYCDMEQKKATNKSIHVIPKR
jgi:hypothetical protein